MLTEDYILMCEKAEEIQKKWKFTEDNRVIHKERLFNRGVNCDKLKFYMVKDYTWLPTQEQLQEMIFSERVGVQTIATAIEQFSKSSLGCDISIKGSMNELWLAFVMKEKYNKIWNGEDWVIE